VSDLHPRARALIDAAKRGEGSVSPDARARVHRSVLRRGVALGATVASASTTSAASKAAALLATVPGSLALPAMVTAIAGAALVVFEARSTPRVSPSPPAASTHAVALARGPLPHAPVDEARAAEPSAPEEPIAPNREAAPPTAPLPEIAAIPMPAQRLRPRAPAAPAPVAAPGRSPIGVASAEPPRALSPPLATSAAPDARAAFAPHLTEDIALLQRARQALRAGDPTTALSLLDRPDSGLDVGPLAEEGLLARISALCQLGRTTEAHAASERFLAAWPASPAAKRLPDACTRARSAQRE
jgi:hypothetical protein